MNTESTGNRSKNIEVKVAEKVLGMSALLAETNQAHGAEPTNTELREHTRLDFDPQRRAEIESHIAHNSEIFQRFVKEVKKKQSSSVKTPSRFSLKEWLDSWSPVSMMRPVLAFASVAVVAVIGLFVFYNQPPSDDNDPRSPRIVSNSGAQTGSDWEVTAVQNGFSHPSTVGRLLNGGNSLNESCATGDCESRLNQLTEFGAVLARSYEQCSESNRLSESRLSDILELRIQVPSRWTGPLSQLQSAAQRSPQTVCRTVNQLSRSFINQ